ncbi:deoxyribodipyrimidine photo-lyase [Maritimibacter sp. HL-12]|uniref:cryptochrome/photolyase family protein n=1 Tax=Maritimibacter sp. HL-12 TaxID=1162418 RepID=UPI000A0F1AA9|nr:deoxyribodipyrimidine photo-lyase [Maritimibacter sp. HL-12]SMH58216.1 deoxyribodipyrimidine photo-lyase type I [Maritimibacter sp. HL-12]
MTDASPILLWFRRDLRLADHPALDAAARSGRPVIGVFIRDESVDSLGAAAKFRLGLSVAALGKTLADHGSRLVLRSGPAAAVLDALIDETGAGAVHWSRLYDPASIARDSAVKAALAARGVAAQSFPGHVLFEPWTVATGQGGPYRVYSPFWRALRGRDPGAPLARPGLMPAPDAWPGSERLADWRLGDAMNRGAEVVAAHARPGEAAAADRLAEFIDAKVDAYKASRDFPGVDATSNLSENLAYGEISARQVWAVGQRAMDEGRAGAEHFLKELVWREFAYHLMYHTPEILTRNWRAEWDGFPWNTDETAPEVLAWKQGRTGEPFVDAAMREMHVTGRMHNRARMIAASYLTKHLMTHWKIGLDWFADHLTDWDPAANAMGWQWVAGSGPDAAPYFRIFNPATQLAKFDPNGDYRRAWIAEGQAGPPATARAFFEAVPRAWGLSPDMSYPAPVVDLAEGRARALAAYGARTK